MAQRTEDLKEEIERTRERIGETVHAIGYRANVPARTKIKVQDTKLKVQETTTTLTELAKEHRTTAALAGLAGVALLAKALGRKSGDDG